MMLKKTATALFFALIAMPVAYQPAHAETLTGAARTEKVKAVETYLNGLKTLKAEFLQTHSDGSRYGGDFYLNRPGRLRFEYRAPLSDYIVADGLLIHYWDNEVKNYSNAPIGTTLADFLLRKNIKLSALIFDQEPLKLRRWQVIDGTGAMTEVSLYNVQTGISVDPRLFVFKAPKAYKSEVDKRM
jgi:outer membrane lipoprotein-sorting protein